MHLIKDFFDNRKLIWELAKNDFEMKYSGSYFGIFWAFLQPVVTTLIYLFVFQIGFKAAPLENDFPFVLWLIAGIIPWFFFAELIMSTTNCFLEYSYLVKKVLFEIQVLPLVKMCSALFVHMFFILLVFVVYAIMGAVPDAHIIQVIYYLFCVICLGLAISYSTSSIQPFFKDFGQMVNIVIQIGMWLTPIMWNYDVIELNPYIKFVFKLNPVFYIVRGYRDAFMGTNWFWEYPIFSVYFWMVTLVLALLGRRTFRHLRPHFADTL